MSETSRGYLTEVKTLREKVAKDIEELNQQIAEGAFRVTNDPRRPLKEPKAEASALSLNFVLLIPEGLPKRPWYQHSLYAPGLYTGYGVKTMPGVREAIEQKDWQQADEQIVKVAAAIMRESALVTKAAVLLEQATNVKPVP